MAGESALLVVGARGIQGHEGGVEKFAEEFVQRLARERPVHVLCLTAPSQPIHENIVVHTVPKMKFGKTDKALYFLYAMALHLRHRYPTVMILGVNFAMLVPMLKAVVWNRPRVFVRSGSIDYTLAKWGRFARSFIRASESMMRIADGSIAVAPSIQKHLAAIEIDSMLIRNGLDMSAEPTPIAQRVPGSVVAIGRLTHQKNYPLLIEASDHLRGSDAHFTIVGGADLSGEADILRQMVAERAQGQVTLAGALPRPKVFDVLARSMLYVNCSHHEGMSNSVLEAIQQGTPLILSDIEANRDLQLAEHHYFDGNSSEALAARIKEALASPERFVVDRARFDNWDVVTERCVHFMQLRRPPSVPVGNGRRA